MTYQCYRISKIILRALSPAPEQVDFTGRKSGSPSPLSLLLGQSSSSVCLSHCCMSTTLVQFIDNIMLIGLGDQEGLGILDASLRHTHTRERERERKVYVTVLEQISFFSGKTHFLHLGLSAHWRRPIYIMEGNIPYLKPIVCKC